MLFLFSFENEKRGRYVSYFHIYFIIVLPVGLDKNKTWCGV